MILELALTLIVPHMVHADVDKVLVQPGIRIVPGQAIVELLIDLSEQFPHDCPPVSRYRVFASESAWLRQVATQGERIAVGAALARFTSEPAEPCDQRATRPLRSSIAAVESQWEAW